MSEPKFIPKPGQVDYTNVRRAPVVNCVVKCGNKILIVKRNPTMHFYPGYWNGISGFLDDGKSIFEKVQEELREEVGIESDRVASFKEGRIFEQEEPTYDKVWIVHPVLVEVASDDITRDWEAVDFRWIVPDDASCFNLLPGFERVLDAFFHDRAKTCTTALDE